MVWTALRLVTPHQLIELDNNRMIPATNLTEMTFASGDAYARQSYHRRSTGKGTGRVSHLGATLRLMRRRIGWAIFYAIVAVYFTVDLAFLSLIRPLRRRLLGGGRMHGWIEGLNRYAALSLVLVPLAILEPVKPLGLYLTAKGHLVSGGSLIAMGEIVKVTLVEQVIEITSRSCRELSLVCLDVHPLGSRGGPAALDQGMAGGQAAVQSILALVRQMKQT